MVVDIWIWDLGKEAPLDINTRNCTVAICSHRYRFNCPDRTCRRIRENLSTELRESLVLSGGWVEEKPERTVGEGEAESVMRTRRGESWGHQSKVKVKGHSVVSDFLRPHGLYSPWNSPGQNTGEGSLSLLQGIFPTPGLNSGLPHCRWILYQLSHQGSPRILEWVAVPFSRGSSSPRNRTGISCIAGGSFTNRAMREALGTSGGRHLKKGKLVSKGDKRIK